MCRTTPRVRNLLEAARTEARRRGDRHLGTEHILLAMLGEQGGIAGRVLRERADPEGLRAGVDEALASARMALGAGPDLPELATAERLPSARVAGPYVELPVEDVGRALAFYRDALGLRARSRSVGRHSGWARLSWGDARLSLGSHADGVRLGFEVLDGLSRDSMLVVGPVGMWAGRGAVQVLGAARTAAPRTSCPQASADAAIAGSTRSTTPPLLSAIHNHPSELAARPPGPTDRPSTPLSGRAPITGGWKRSTFGTYAVRKGPSELTVLIGSACRCTTLHVPSSRRRVVVVRRSHEVTGPPPTLIFPCSTS